MNPVFAVIDLALSLLEMALLIWIILGWLIQFNVVNARQPFVYRVNEALTRLFEPMLKPIRKIVPNMGTLDISPIILFLIIFFLRSCLVYYS